MLNEVYSNITGCGVQGPSMESQCRHLSISHVITATVSLEHGLQE